MNVLPRGLHNTMWRVFRLTVRVDELFSQARERERRDEIFSLTFLPLNERVDRHLEMVSVGESLRCAYHRRRRLVSVLHEKIQPAEQPSVGRTIKYLITEQTAEPSSL
jgi:hypothetical protein